MSSRVLVIDPCEDRRAALETALRAAYFEVAAAAAPPDGAAQADLLILAPPTDATGTAEIARIVAGPAPHPPVLAVSPRGAGFAAAALRAGAGDHLEWPADAAEIVARARGLI
ncbi:MAG: hypothetical protein ACK5MQ_06925, partial [Pikeienuella sp.]